MKSMYRARQANMCIVIKCKYFNNYNRYEVVTFMDFKVQYFINLVMQKRNEFAGLIGLKRPPKT